MNKLIARAALALSIFLSACGRLDSEIVEYQGRDVEIVDAGDGRTTVVFEAGLGDGWDRWNRVASEVSENTRVFAYSRPGYGDSDPTTAPRDPAHIVEDLHGLLAQQEIAPPYILVGHSNGGAYMELFARQHADEVAGLVLVDTRPADFLEECEDRGLDQCGVPAAVLAKESDVFRAEYEGFAAASEQMNDAGALGDYPVRVLTATRLNGVSRARMDLKVSMQREIADEAEDGEQTLLDAGHYLQRWRARKVTKAIRALL
ncbi:MAG TPA: alpha/beta hydrolase [Nannocystaceae bacterium]|nr:alpha/beta hydrolase [Nannocystaceae bacterium]